MATKNNPRYTPKRIGENQYFVFDNKTGKTTDHLGRHPQFEKQVKEVCDQLNSPLPTPVGELPEDYNHELKVRENPRNGIYEINITGFNINGTDLAEMTTNHPVEMQKRMAEELVKRYNAYPELLREHERMVKHDAQLQEQNRVLREVLDEASNRIANCIDLWQMPDEAVAMLRTEIAAMMKALPEDYTPN